MAYVDFLSVIHKATKRDYLARVNEYPKAEAIKISRKYDYDYWDGDRKFGYGGYKYDGRWRKVARAMIDHYGLKPGDKILDVGCGKAFLLYDFTQELPGVEIAGIDTSQYGLDHAKEEVKPFLQNADMRQLPFPDKSFDLVYSINCIHNLHAFDVVKAAAEMERVGRKHKYICTESFRNEEEQVNLMYWVLTGRCFYSPEEWEWFLYKLGGYTGDYSLIFFE
ncbi:MAG TPA: class I SAM-dependent methyltransferase [Candidatus Methanoperedens sp.]|nr:class I SAM-dependent methyltransferase [Candidatus Methanoperedens sp.]